MPWQPSRHLGIVSATFFPSYECKGFISPWTDICISQFIQLEKRDLGAPENCSWLFCCCFLLPLAYLKSILNPSLSVLSLQYQTVVLLASLSESSLPWWEMIALNSLCACHPFCWTGGRKGKPSPSSSTSSSSHSSHYKGLKRNRVKLNIIDNWLWDHGTLCPFCTCIWS